VAWIDDLVRHDDVAAGVDCRLQVVADQPGAFAGRRHGAGVRVGERDLTVGRRSYRLLHSFQLAHLPTQLAEPSGQPDIA